MSDKLRDKLHEIVEKWRKRQRDFDRAILLAAQPPAKETK